MALLSAQAEETTLYLSFGEKADSVEAWDGNMRVRGGTVVHMEGRHFMSSDQIDAKGNWKISTREEHIRGFPRVNYNEMSPHELPPTQYSPVGLYVVVDGSFATTFRMRTKQGNVNFSLGLSLIHI